VFTIIALSAHARSIVAISILDKRTLTARPPTAIASPNARQPRR
jgi:hypothetical protein